MDAMRTVVRTWMDRPQAISNARCVRKPIGCSRPVDGFRDELSYKEYNISGLCQKCQDEIFTEGE